MTLLISVTRWLVEVGHLRNERSIGLDDLLDNNDTSSKYIFMYGKHVYQITPNRNECCKVKFTNVYICIASVDKLC